MSGHSKWSTIKRQKGVADIKRGQTFTKLANIITVVTKQGNSGDPTSNPRLRAVLDDARSVNMPKGNIQRAIDRGLGKLPGQTIDEVLYEGFGPPAGGGKVAFLVEGMTDNRFRTNAEIRNLFERVGGIMGAQGSVAYMFDKKGEIRISGKGGSIEDEMMELIDLGVEDVDDYVEDEVQKYLIYIDIPELNTMGTKITQVGFEIESSGIIFKPNITVEINDKVSAEKLVNFCEKLENNDDVQKVFTNMDIRDGLI